MQKERERGEERERRERKNTFDCMAE